MKRWRVSFASPCLLTPKHQELGLANCLVVTPEEAVAVADLASSIATFLELEYKERDLALEVGECSVWLVTKTS